MELSPQLAKIKSNLAMMIMLLVSTYDLVTRIDSIYGTGVTNKMKI